MGIGRVHLQVQSGGDANADRSSQAQLAQQLETQFASLQPDEQMRVASTRMLELRRAVSMASSPSRQARVTAFDA